MAPRAMQHTSNPHAGDSDSDDAPEAVTNAQSKVSAKRKEAALQEAENERKRKRKEDNRKRDETMKRRKEESGKVLGKSTRKKKNVHEEDEDEEVDGVMDGVGSSSSGNSKRGEMSRMSVEERMERAMREAEGEDMSGDEDDDLKLDGDVNMTFPPGLGSEEDEEDAEGEDEDEGTESDSEGDEEDEEGSQDEGDEDSEEDDALGSDVEDAIPSRIALKPRNKVGYLPEHVFATALSSSSSRKAGKGKSVDVSSKSLKSAKLQRKKRKSKRDGPKDIIVGSKTIRTHPSVTNAATNASRAAARTVPPPKVKKLVKRSLALSREVSKERKGGKRTKAGWERRIASVGNLRRSTRGPALRFVRA